MTESPLIRRADDQDFDHLFRLDLFWGAPDQAPVVLELNDGSSFKATNVSTFKGVRVWEIPALPGSSAEAALDRLLAKHSTNRLVIFHDDEKQVWRWPSRSARGGGVVSRAARHVHRSGVPDPSFEAKLQAIQLPRENVVDVNELLSRVRSAFDVETKQETKRASKLMARMYAAVEKQYPKGVSASRRDHEISVTLARVLFLLFGDDTEMWKSADGLVLPNLFQDFIKDSTKRDGSDLADRLNALFVALNSPTGARRGRAGMEATFPYVNGGIFEEEITLPRLDAEFRDAVLAASAVDWSTISPAIFGSMFQSVRDAQTRRELGEHYTSEENILKTLNPLFLDELRTDFEAAVSRETPKKQINALQALWSRLGELRYMDPACGCGNFIIVAYRELRDIELRIMDALATLQHGEDAVTLDTDWTPLLKVGLDGFHGIEIDEWPARIAETAMFLMDRQCDLRMRERFGTAPERLPIRKQARIVVGNALTLDWSEVCPASADVIVAGNPPFLGHATRTELQAQELRDVWGKDDISRLDYVTGWHAKTMHYFGKSAGRWAFVTTNSITQGDPVPHLFEPIFDSGWDIKFAHRTFPWTSEAAGKAAVHCVIVGFARQVTAPMIFDMSAWGPEPRRAKQVNGYLVDAPRAFIVKRTVPLSPRLPLATFGNMPRDDGNLIVEVADHGIVVADPIARAYLRPFVGSDELLNNKQRWCLWLTEASASEIKRSAVLRERTDAVKAFRAKSSAASTRAMASTPHLFGQRPALHSRPYVIIPRVASDQRPYFLVQHVQPDVIASDATFTAADPDGFLFGVISSSMFLVWQRTVGGRLKSDLRFSNTIVWNNLPLPPLTKEDRAAIASAGKRLGAARSAQKGLSLAAMYRGELHPDLSAAHGELDGLVDQAFGVEEAHPTDEMRQAALFDSYVRMTRL